MCIRDRCAFNRTLVNASSVDDERLLCLVPPSLIGAGPLSVSISLNGQQFSRLALRFQQYEEPRVLSLGGVRKRERTRGRGGARVDTVMVLGWDTY